MNVQEAQKLYAQKKEEHEKARNNYESIISKISSLEDEIPKLAVSVDESKRKVKEAMRANGLGELSDAELSEANQKHAALESDLKLKKATLEEVGRLKRSLGQDRTAASTEEHQAKRKVYFERIKEIQSSFKPSAEDLELINELRSVNRLCGMRDRDGMDQLISGLFPSVSDPDKRKELDEETTQSLGLD